MIRINLASRKQSQSTGDSKIGLSSRLGGFDSDFFKDPIVYRTLLVAFLCFLAGNVADSFKEEKMKRVEGALAAMTADRTKLEKESGQMKYYEELRKSLEADEAIIKRKLDTILELIADRNVPPRILRTLANSIPKEVWLSQFAIRDGEVTIKGGAAGFTQISDFIKALTESAYFGDVNMKNSVQGKEGGADIAEFELAAKQSKGIFRGR
ncbi:MAG: hypothetical protein A2428_11555 [Bdellovibrionales bacterium RIFOXYC1_FULL_54_43]|nr:MAG: hypothetical protein A2428_11555 [Bdellovibrionales bacterium RIFOXYC1_FULL_54_43]OFZ79989.1 MAG: hypothetical protein A2603_02125 [Bdellovibrionales bacterium RIFOXYD1_FULL_55_31]